TAYTPIVTPRPQPIVITTHPAPSAFESFKTTPPTTPPPKITRIIVPISSAKNSGILNTPLLAFSTQSTRLTAKKKDPYCNRGTLLKVPLQCRSPNLQHVLNL